MPKAIPIILVPLVILTGAGLLLPWLEVLPLADRESLALVPHFLAGAGLLAGVHFRRGRMVLALCLLALTYHLFRTMLAAGLTSAESSLWYRAAALVVPANMLLLAIMREKGVCSSVGRLRLAVMGGQLFAVWFTIRYRYDQLWDGLSAPLLTLPLMDRLLMPQGGALLLLAAAAIAGIKGVKRETPIDGGLFGNCIALFFMLNWLWVPHVPLVFSSAGALVLLAALLHDSHNMAFCDELTGLPSRRALNEDLRGLGRRYAVAMVDVDHFKRFNDVHGHSVGDQVLRMVASRLQRVGAGGKAYRYGGEEFAIIFSGKGVREVISPLEELRGTIADYRMVLRDKDRPTDDQAGRSRRNSRQGGDTVSVTVSIGVADTGDGGGPDEVVGSADRALYRAKGKGRNQVCS
jgi:diguanylate cyclase (GGDEF)-like protein